MKHKVAPSPLFWALSFKSNFLKVRYLEHVQCRVSLKYHNRGNLRSGQLIITFSFAIIRQIISWRSDTLDWVLTIFGRLILTSPRGTRSSLLLPRPKDKLATSFEDWPFLSVHYWGEDPTGQWTLQVLLEIVWIFLNLLKSVESWL